jgi:dolichol-phosphate mannosyltransferase
MTPRQPDILDPANGMTDAESTLRPLNIAVVIPAYRVEREIEGVIASIPSYIATIVVVDDASTDATKEVVGRIIPSDSRLVLLTHTKNLGVGASMVTGFKEALAREAAIIVKIDGDGQMAVERLPDLLAPLIEGRADFAKGNRFHDLSALQSMPLLRRIGNVGLSFLAKAATGYWDCFDPTNGFLALRGDVSARLPLHRLDSRYFFEISLLGELYLQQAVVSDVPIPARYGAEESNLSIAKALVTFPWKLIALLGRRIALKYFVYDFTIGSLYFTCGIPLATFGLVFGVINWIKYASQGLPAPTGTVMLATLPFILGFQLLLSAIGFDLQSVPCHPLGGPLVLKDARSRHR